MFKTQNFNRGDFESVLIKIFCRFKRNVIKVNYEQSWLKKGGHVHTPCVKTAMVRYFGGCIHL